jgi:carboxypeptidase C (cathepsin A)
MNNDTTVPKWQYEALEAKCEAVQRDNLELVKQLCNISDSDDKTETIGWQTGSVFINELYKLMKNHGVDRITPLNMDAYMDINQDIFIRYFYFHGHTSRKDSETES